ncbi:SRSF protein kinase 1-like [Alosa alosa]|uniref:SRSF protein kinase 1-like n=1 Tax=Alosa alosa TaxID=278164 RepID=UPI0020151D7A|nr:SRSF protein kinase 1-like [Alosa alosa]
MSKNRKKKLKKKQKKQAELLEKRNLELGDGQRPLEAGDDEEEDEDTDAPDRAPSATPSNQHTLHTPSRGWSRGTGAADHLIGAPAL